MSKTDNTEAKRVYDVITDHLAGLSREGRSVNMEDLRRFADVTMDSATLVVNFVAKDGHDSDAIVFYTEYKDESSLALVKTERGSVGRAIAEPGSPVAWAYAMGASNALDLTEKDAWEIDQDGAEPLLVAPPTMPDGWSLN